MKTLFFFKGLLGTQLLASVSSNPNTVIYQSLICFLVPETRYPTLTRISPYILEDLTKFILQILNSMRLTTVGIVCDDATDILAIYNPMCSGVFDDLRLKFNLTANRYYVNGSDTATTKRYLDEVRTQSRGNQRYGFCATVVSGFR